MIRYVLIAALAVLMGALSSCAAENTEAPAQLELTAPQGDIVLEISGALTNLNSETAAQFDMAMLHALPRVRLDTHTSVTDGVQQFDGVLLRDLLRALGAEGAQIRASASNDYAVEIPMSDVQKFDVIVAYSLNGAPLSPSDKGPLWLVYPRDQHAELQDIRYDYRWVWHLTALEIR